MVDTTHPWVRYTSIFSFLLLLSAKKIDLCGSTQHSFEGVQLHLQIKNVSQPSCVYPGLLLIATHFFSEAQEDICQTAAAAIEMS